MNIAENDQRQTGTATPGDREVLPWYGRPAAVLGWVGVLAFFFANVEIQIEGAAGWAAGLPTWRIERHPLMDLFWGGRALTGYHVWVFAFMILVFHLGIFLSGTFSGRLELRVLGCIMLFWILEDFLWFVLNPAFGLAKFNPAHVPWHKHWLLGVPADYLSTTALGAVLVTLSYRRKPPGLRRLFRRES